MIEARKSAWFSRWFAANAAKRIRASFSAVRIRGLEPLRTALAVAPVLVISNHTSWWDPLVSLVLCQRVLGADAYAMMDAENLGALPFFALVGAFGVALDDPADGARAIRYAAKRLTAPGKIVWIFPQGREVPITSRPLVFRPGSAEISRVAKQAVVAPVALRYEHGKRPEPVLWIAVGIPERCPPDRDVLARRRAQEHAVTEELDRIDRAIATGADDDFQLLFRKDDDRWGRLAQALLAWMTRPRRMR